MDPRINLANEFCYRPHSDSEEYDPMNILPPVPNCLGGAGNCVPGSVNLPMVRLVTYESRRYNELTWEDINTGKVMRFADITTEIRTNGPVIARFVLDSSFRNWSRGSALNSIYEGLPFAERSDAARCGQAGHVHDVPVIGFGGGQGDGEGYFIGQNCYGAEWGRQWSLQIVSQECLSGYCSDPFALKKKTLCTTVYLGSKTCRLYLRICSETDGL